MGTNKNDGWEDFDLPEDDKSKAIIVAPPPNPKPSMGKKSKYDPIIAEQILQKIASSTSSVRKICQRVGLDYDLFKAWLSQVPGFMAKYKAAKMMQAHELAEEALEISDETVEKNDMASANMKKLAVTTRLHLAAVLNPKDYGKNQEVSHTVDVNHTLSGDQFDQLVEKMIQTKKQTSIGNGYEDAELVSPDSDEGDDEDNSQEDNNSDWD